MMISIKIIKPFSGEVTIRAKLNNPHMTWGFVIKEYRHGFYAFQWIHDEQDSMHSFQAFIMAAIDQANGIHQF